MVPNEWDVKPLSDIATVTSGGTPSKVRSEYWDNGTVPWVRTTEVQNCVLNYEDVKEYITKEGLKNSSAKLVPPGTVLLAMIGQGKTRGQVALMSFEAAVNQNCAAIIFDSDQDPEFHFNFLLSQYDNIRGMSNSAGQSNLSGALVKAIRVPVPPLSEQKKIAKILAAWDKSIFKTEQLINNSRLQKKALLQQLITGKKRLLDESGFQFSEEWKLTTISSFLRESRITGSSGDVAKKLTVKLYGNGVVAKDEKRAGSGSTKYYRRKAGQFIYSKLDFLNGAFGLIPNCLDGYESTLDLPAFDFINRISVEWFIYFVSREEFYTANLGLANGGRKARRVNPKDFLAIKIPIPRLEEQQKVAAVISLADQEIAILKQNLYALKREKKALFQKLLTGKLRVVGVTQKTQEKSEV